LLDFAAGPARSSWGVAVAVAVNDHVNVNVNDHHAHDHGRLGSRGSATEGASPAGRGSRCSGTTRR
jgi:hypothetical protein